MPHYWSIPEIDKALRPVEDAKSGGHPPWVAFLRIMGAMPPYLRLLVLQLVQAWANAPWYKVRWGRTRWKWERNALRQLRDYQKAHGLLLRKPGKLDSGCEEQLRRFNDATRLGKIPEGFDMSSIFGIGVVDLRTEMDAKHPPASYTHLDDIRWENPPIDAVAELAAIDGMSPARGGRPKFAEVRRHWWTERNAIAVILMEHLKEFSGSYHHRDLADVLSVFTSKAISEADLKNLTDRYAMKIPQAVATLFPRAKAVRRPRKKK